MPLMSKDETKRTTVIVLLSSITKLFLNYFANQERTLTIDQDPVLSKQIKSWLEIKRSSILTSLHEQSLESMSNSFRRKLNQISLWLLFVIFRLQPIHSEI